MIQCLKLHTSNHFVHRSLGEDEATRIHFVHRSLGEDEVSRIQNPLSLPLKFHVKHPAWKT